MKLIHKTFDQLNTRELYNIISLRESVFIVEQNCPYLDCDGQDLPSEHLWLEKDGIVVAYVRLVPPNPKENWSIGRVVTNPEFRGFGLGKKIMLEAIRLLAQKEQVDKIEISAQVYLLKFYNELGFLEIGNQYLEDDIPHIKMIWKKP